MSKIEPEQELQEAVQELPQQVVGVGGAKGSRLPRQLSVFRHRNYALFFSGQLISLTGTWLQQFAQNWQVMDILAHKHIRPELTMGVVSFLSALPVLLLSFYAGTVVDRLNKRNLIIVTQTIMMILAFILSALTHWNVITVIQIAVIGFCLGTANAFDAPARQSFIVDMVGREDLPNAIALNSAMFNGARILGPGVAAVVISAVRYAGAYFLNGVSFIAVIIGLLLMRVNHATPKPAGSAWLEFKEGLRFIRRQPMVKALLILIGISSIFAAPYAVLMPIFARYILHLDVKGYGSLFVATGVGALVGAFVLSSLGDIKWRGKLLFAGNMAFCSALIGFSFARTMVVALPLLFVAGYGMITQMALTNTLIQMSVPDKLRGRVISVYTFMFIGMMPIGSLEAGVVAHKLGVVWTIRLGAAVCAAAALILAPRFVRSN